MAARELGAGEAGGVSEEVRAAIEESIGEKCVNFAAKGISFGDAGAVFLAGKLRGNTTVEDLQLRWRGIGAMGARALAEALGEDNTTLETLDLHGNRFFGDDGAEAMAQMLKKNVTLEVLILNFCGVGNRGARALAEALKENCALKTLYLDFNQFGDESSEALAEALRWNESLEYLRLCYCHLTNTGAPSLLAALRESNSTLDSLRLAGNSGIEDIRIVDSIQELIKENQSVVPETAERRARCLLFCCLQLASTAHEHVVPSIGAVPVPVMQYAVEHAGTLHVAKRFEHGNAVAVHSSADVRARSSPSLSSSDSSDDLESATSRRR